MIYICIDHATIYCHSRYGITANMNTPQTTFITLSAMKVTNTDHTAIGYHTKCRMNQNILFMYRYYNNVYMLKM